MYFINSFILNFLFFIFTDLNPDDPPALPLLNDSGNSNAIIDLTDLSVYVSVCNVIILLFHL